MSGKIKYYNSEKGYGFISADNGEDVFFHIHDVNADMRTLVTGTPCTFEKKKYTAKDGTTRTKADAMKIV